MGSTEVSPVWFRGGRWVGGRGSRCRSPFTRLARELMPWCEDTYLTETSTSCMPLMRQAGHISSSASQTINEVDYCNSALEKVK